MEVEHQWESRATASCLALSAARWHSPPYYRKYWMKIQNLDILSVVRLQRFHQPVQSMINACFARICSHLMPGGCINGTRCQWWSSLFNNTLHSIHSSIDSTLFIASNQNRRRFGVILALPQKEEAAQIYKEGGFSIPQKLPHRGIRHWFSGLNLVKKKRESTDLFRESYAQRNSPPTTIVPGQICWIQVSWLLVEINKT